MDANYKRQGLGSTICRVMAKKLADLDMDSYACVNKNNVPSIKMFEKIGFRHVDDVHWIMTYSTEMFTWHDN